MLPGYFSIALFLLPIARSRAAHVAVGMRERSLPSLHRPVGTQLRPAPSPTHALGLTGSLGQRCSPAGLVPRAESPPALPGCRAPPASAESDAPHHASSPSTSVQVWPFSHP